MLPSASSTLPTQMLIISLSHPAIRSFFVLSPPLSFTPLFDLSSALCRQWEGQGVATAGHDDCVGVSSNRSTNIVDELTQLLCEGEALTAAPLHIVDVGRATR